VRLPTADLILPTPRQVGRLYAVPEAGDALLVLWDAGDSEDGFVDLSPLTAAVALRRAGIDPRDHALTLTNAPVPLAEGPHNPSSALEKIRFRGVQGPSLYSRGPAQFAAHR
jgi:hypothetical protein